MSSSHEDHTATIQTIVFLLTLVTFVIVGAYMEEKHFIFGHETGVIILLGMLVSWIMYSIDEKYVI